MLYVQWIINQQEFMMMNGLPKLPNLFHFLSLIKMWNISIEVYRLLLGMSLLSAVRFADSINPTETGDKILVFGRPVTLCKAGFGYPVFCPQVTDPANRTRCCRHIDKPRCCDERATRVCMRPNMGRKAGTNIDPDPKDDAIFCPGPNDPDYYDVCCWRKYSTECCSRYLTPYIFTGVFGGLALLGIGGIFGILFLKRKGSLDMVKSREDMKSQKSART